MALGGTRSFRVSLSLLASRSVRLCLAVGVLEGISKGSPWSWSVCKVGGVFGGA